MAEKLGAVARAATVFGEPVERDGITVIPVAKADGDSAAVQVSVKTKALVVNKRMEPGGGGGVQVTPVGFIEIKNNEENFARSERSPFLDYLWEVS